MIKRNIKMLVTPEESKQVQEICFANDIVWENKYKECSHTDKKFLCIDDYLTWEDVDFNFEVNLNEEVDASFFIKTKGTCIEETQEQELNKNIKEEQMKDNEVETYKDVKEYLVAKGLYEAVLSFDIDFEGYSHYFGNMFWFDKTPQGFEFWVKIEKELVKLEINDKLDEILEDYKVRKLERTLEEIVEQTSEQPTEAKPKQYLVFVPTKGKPKHIHQSLKSAQEEAKRLCKSGLCDVMVLEVVSKYQAKVIVEEV